jgi:hypothetical protein
VQRIDMRCNASANLADQSCAGRAVSRLQSLTYQTERNDMYISGGILLLIIIIILLILIF